jgi:hypothetical protein
MKYKKYLQKIIDRQFKTDLEEFFGKKSYISISNVTYIRSKDSYLVSVNLYLDEPEKIDLLFPSALEMLVQRAWNVVVPGCTPARCHKFSQGILCLVMRVSPGYWGS